jgi:hypothetical protein
MRLRHAAALALTGWYLMVPPFGADGQPQPITPLGQWEILESTDSAADCASARNGYISGKLQPKEEMLAQDWVDNPAKHPKLLHIGQRMLQTSPLRLLKLVCIATDDPRLKGN